MRESGWDVDEACDSNHGKEVPTTQNVSDVEYV